MRDTFTHTAKADTNEINIKTMRLMLVGQALVPELQYLVQLAFGSNDFEKDNASPLVEAYVEYTGWRDLNVRVGQLFVPFDRARTIREFALRLVDRPQVVQELTLDRDVGIMLSSSDLFGRRVLGYNLFVGGGEGRNRFGGQAQGPLGVLRLTLRPFGPFDDDFEGDLERLPRPRLAISVAGAYNYQTNREKSTYGKTLTLGTLDYTHGAADVVFKYAGFSLLTEVLVRRARQAHLDDEVDGAAVREWSRSGWSYLVQAGMMVSRRVEIAARWDHLVALTGTGPGRGGLSARRAERRGAPRRGARSDAQGRRRGARAAPSQAPARGADRGGGAGRRHAHATVRALHAHARRGSRAPRRARTRYLRHPSDDVSSRVWVRAAWHPPKDVPPPA
jgi:hypothetical protein